MGVRVTVYPGQAIAEALKATTRERVKIATEIVGEFAATAPVESGEFVGGIGVKAAGDRVFVVDEDPEAFYKEYGTVDTPAHATLTTAASKHGRYSGYQPRGR